MKKRKVGSKNNIYIEYVFILAAALSLSLILSSPKTTGFATSNTTSNLVAYYKFDEGRVPGNSILDSSGNGNNGVNYGASQTTGISGDALQFNGTNSYVNIGNIASFKIPSKTIMFWAKPSGNVTTTSPIFSSSAGNYYVGFANANTMIFSYANAAGTQKTFYIAGVVPNEWHFYTYVFNVSGSSVTMTGYKDGALLSTRTDTGGYSSLYGSNFIIGAFASTTYFFNGSIDEVKVWNRALSAAEIQNQLINDAQFVSQDVPSAMTVGKNYQVVVTMKNTGTTTWTKNAKYRLGSQNPQDNLIWGLGRVELSDSDSIQPGQTKTFVFNITVPATSGNYNFQWRMLRELVEWFGESTPNLAITVFNISSTPITYNLWNATDPAIGHIIGGAEGTAWSADVTRDNEGFLSYGPYIDTLNDGATYQVTWSLMQDVRNATNEAVVRIEVYDYTANKVLTSHDIYRKDFYSDFTYQDFSLNFTYSKGHKMEFRAWWYDKAYIKLEKIYVTQVPVSTGTGLVAYQCTNNSTIGDIDDDGSVTKEDADIVLNMSVGNIPIPDNTCCIDLNKDGKVNSGDAVLILQIANGTIPGMGRCSPTIINATINVSTLKKTYKVGEQVNLTDPPEAITELPVTEERIARTTYVTGRPPALKSHGYIIEFKEPPIVKKGAELKGKVEITRAALRIEENNYNNISTEGWNAINPAAQILKWWSGVQVSNLNNTVNALEKNLTLDLKKYKSDLLNYHSSFKQKLAGAGISITGGVTGGETKSKITEEYVNVFNGLSMNISSLEAEKIKSLPEVENVYPNLQVNVTLMDSVPLINADGVWLMKDSGGSNIRGKGITIAIIDTGVDYTRPDLGGCLGKGCKVIGGYDFVTCDSIGAYGICYLPRLEDADPMDDMGHGTHVASIAAGNGVLKGVAPDAKILAYKVLNGDGAGYSSWIIAGIERAVDPNQDGNFSDHANVISMSLGVYCGGYYSQDCGPDDAVSIAVDNAVSAGVVAVISAGNSGPYEQTIGSPGTARKAITVGATYKKDYTGTYWGDVNPKADQITTFSSRGPVLLENVDLIKPDVVAPGAIICAAQYDSAWNDKKCLDNKHIAISGTSMSAPHVAGAVALIKQAHPDWNPEEIKMALRNTAKKLIDPATGQEYDINTQGYGRIDVLKAVQSNKPPIAIIEPFNPFILKTTNIIGTATGDSYIVDYSDIMNPTSWTRISSGSSTINGTLARLNSSNLAEGEYILRLTTVNSITQTRSEDKILFFIVKNKEGWPQKTNGTMRGSEMMVGDIDNDGKDEIIATVSGGLYGKMYVWKSDGNLLSGWPKDLQCGENRGSPGLYDIDKDGKLEIIYGDCLEIHAWRSDGSEVNGWPVRYNCLNDIPNNFVDVDFIPTFNDINNDGNIKIIFSYTCRDGYDYISVLKGDGTSLNGWPQKINPPDSPGYPGFTSPIVVDANNDGIKEIYVATSNSMVGSVMKLYGWKSDGNLLSGWPVNITNPITNSPIAADINGDGKLEILISSMSKKSRVYAFNYDGTPVTGWPQNTTYLGGQVIAGDIDNDGDVEVLAPSSDGYVYAWHGNGIPVQNWPINVGYYFTNSISLGDINNDNNDEIVFGTINSNKLFAYNYLGGIVNGFPKYIFSNGIYMTPTLADIDNNGNLEIIVGSTDGYVYIWDLGTRYNPAKMDWPMFQHDPQHTGCYDCDKKLKSLVKSMINNTGGLAISGYLQMKVQKLSSGVWADVKTVADDFVNNSKRIIMPSSYLALDKVWDSRGAFTPTQTGSYRVNVALLDSNKNVITTSDGRPLTAYYEFTVV